MKIKAATKSLMGIFSLFLLTNNSGDPKSWLYLCEDLSSPSQNQRQSNHEWKAATFRGLKVGYSSIDDALRILGQPEWSGPQADQDVTDPNPALYYSFSKGGDFPGELVVIVDKKSKKIFEILNIPQKLSKKGAIHHFGSGFIVAKYEFCPDIDNTVIPVYPDPNGQLIQVEYRRRGIILSLRDDESVQEIAYVARNDALPSKEGCKKWAQKDHESKSRRKPL
ncbi:MAG: hypothetical protein ACREYF_18590 [Gammaproteobacteria bacterium]